MSLRIRLKYPDVETFVAKYATNISRGGMFIQSRVPQPVGTRIRFEMVLKSGAVLLRGEGKVIWIKEYDAAHPQQAHGMGVRFTALDEQSQAMVDRVLAFKKSKGLKSQPAVSRDSTVKTTMPGQTETDETPIDAEQDEGSFDLVGAQAAVRPPPLEAVPGRRALDDRGSGEPATSDLPTEMPELRPSPPELWPSPPLPPSGLERRLSSLEQMETEGQEPEPAVSELHETPPGFQPEEPSMLPEPEEMPQPGAAADIPASDHLSTSPRNALHAPFALEPPADGRPVRGRDGVPASVSVALTMAEEVLVEILAQTSLPESRVAETLARAVSAPVSLEGLEQLRDLAVWPIELGPLPPVEEIVRLLAARLRPPQAAETAAAAFETAGQPLRSSPLSPRPEPFPEAEPFSETEPTLGPEPFSETEPTLGPEPFSETEPTFQPEPLSEAEPTFQPGPGMHALPADDDELVMAEPEERATTPYLGPQDDSPESLSQNVMDEMIEEEMESRPLWENGRRALEMAADLAVQQAVTVKRSVHEILPQMEEIEEEGFLQAPAGKREEVEQAAAPGGKEASYGEIKRREAPADSPFEEPAMPRNAALYVSPGMERVASEEYEYQGEPIMPEDLEMQIEEEPADEEAHLVDPLDATPLDTSPLYEMPPGAHPAAGQHDDATMVAGPPDFDDVGSEDLPADDLFSGRDLERDGLDDLADQDPARPSSPTAAPLVSGARPSAARQQSGVSIEELARESGSPPSRPQSPNHDGPSPLEELARESMAPQPILRQEGEGLLEELAGIRVVADASAEPLPGSEMDDAPVDRSPTQDEADRPKKGFFKRLFKKKE